MTTDPETRPGLDAQAAGVSETQSSEAQPNEALALGVDAPFRPPPGPSPDAAPVELWRPKRAKGARVILLCDHASNARPAALADLGLAADDLERHIAYDIGARGVTLALAEALATPAALTTFSRLVIDPNRGEDDPTVLMRLYDRTIIPGNAAADAAEKERRLARFHRPYHAAVAALLDAAAPTDPASAPPLVLSIHSFTPQLVGRPPRPWGLGVLWRDDPKTATAMLEALRAEGDLEVGDNEPYPGALDGDTQTRHASARGWPHVVLEVRQDLIATAAEQAAMAERLARALERVVH